MKPLLCDFTGSQRRLRADFAGGGHKEPFAGIHRAAVRIPDRLEIFAGSLSSDPENGVRTGAVLIVAPDRVYPDHTELASSESSRNDGIVVTSNHLHFEPCRPLLESDIQFICDKPLVNRNDEARTLIELAARTDTYFAVTYTCTGYPMVCDARKDIHASEIGAVRIMYVEYLHEWLVDVPTKPGECGLWCVDPAEAGPDCALGDVGTHAFQFLETLSGQCRIALSAKLKKTAAGFKSDNTVVLLSFCSSSAAMRKGLLWRSIATPDRTTWRS